jgi:hypothetical protein
VLIVQLALVIVGKDLIGLRYGFELDVCFFALVFGDLVGVGCEGGFVVCLLYLCFGCGFGNAEDLYSVQLDGSYS